MSEIMKKYGQIYLQYLGPLQARYVRETFDERNPCRLIKIMNRLLNPQKNGGEASSILSEPTEVAVHVEDM